MNKLRFDKYILCLLALAAFLASAGCGGGDKNKTESKTETGNTVTGKVDLFSGYGVELDSVGRAKLLADAVSVRVYRLQPDGSNFVPLPNVPASQLEGDTFRLERVPNGERNLIVRLETADSKPILAAILPPVKAGENTVVVSPETDLETALFQRIAQSGVRAPKDIKPWEFDASFVKDIITDSLFYDMQGPKDSALAADALLPVARAAYARFLDTLLGKIGVAANDKEALKLLDPLAPGLMSMALDYESGGASAERLEDFSATLKRVTREAGLKSAQMSGEAIWTAARRQSLLWAARCIAGAPGADGCPTSPYAESSIQPYGALLEKALAGRWAAEDMAERRLEFSAATPATGAVSVPSLIAIKRLTGMSEKTVAAFNGAFAKIDASPDPERRVELQMRLMQDIRDVLLLGAAGMATDDAGALEKDLSASAKPLANALNNPASNIALIGATHQEFVNACDRAFQPLAALTAARYPKLDKTDLGKLNWALREIVLDATLYELPRVYFASVDTDGDGAPDNEERVVGTDPSSGKSMPAPVLVVTPASMLPDQPADTDDDGFIDAVESAVGKNPKDEASAPAPGRMALCGKPAPGCLAPLPETVAASSSFEGTAYYLGEAAQGLFAGVYSSAKFTGNQPLMLAAAPSGRNGAFKIENIMPGRYFIAGFTDASGSGKPESGDSVGYVGANYPRRITAASGITKIDENLTVFGVIGKPVCPENQLYNPASETCGSECPAGMEASRLLRACRCESGYFSPATSSCAEKCPEPFIAGRAGSCDCPPGMQLEKSADAKSGKCVEAKKEVIVEKPVLKDEKESRMIGEPPLSPVTDKVIHNPADTPARPPFRPGGPVMAPNAK
ncbi:MAG: hypothetical protein WCX65_02850 [bacterium]